MFADIHAYHALRDMAPATMLQSSATGGYANPCTYIDKRENPYTLKGFSWYPDCPVKITATCPAGQYAIVGKDSQVCGLADGTVVGKYYQGTDLRDAAHAHNVNAYAGFYHGNSHVKTG